MTLLRTLAALAFAACWRSPPPPLPIAPPEQPTPTPTSATTEDESNFLDHKSFLALLRRDDWSDLIDPAIGFVALNETPSASDPTKHDVDIRRRCGPRASQWAKFEALSLAAQVISSGQKVNCVSHRATKLVECSHDHGRMTRFSFAQRDPDFILAGIASFEPGTISAADEQKYAAEMRSAGRCP